MWSHLPPPTTGGPGRSSSPFAAAERRAELEEEFMAFWTIAVETSDDAEEQWAYEKAKALYLANVVSDRQSWPEAMWWAADRYSAASCAPA